MPITYNISTDYLYNKGIEDGIAEGMEKKNLDVVRKALSNQKLSVEEIAELADVSIDFVLSVQSEMEGKDS